MDFLEKKESFGFNHSLGCVYPTLYISRLLGRVYHFSWLICYPCSFLCAIDLYSKYVFVIPLKDKKGISIVNAFDKIIKQSNRKPNKIWIDQGGEFYNNVFKKWLSDNDVIMYSRYNEGKSVVAERFIRTLKNKFYKHMTATGKNVYYDVLDDVVNKYNNTKHSTIKMKPIDVGDNNKSIY